MSVTSLPGWHSTSFRSIHVGYLELHGFPRADDYVYEIDELSPAMFANDAKGKIAFQKKRVSNAQFMLISMELPKRDEKVI